MMRFISQMVQLPLNIAVYSMGMFVNAITGMQQMLDSNLGTRKATGPGPLKPMLVDGLETICVDEKAEPLRTKETITVTDQDLSGDSLKVVRYRIIFTKRDYEATLYEDEEVVNYPTNGGSYGGLKVADFFVEVQPTLERPTLWKQLNYPPPGPGPVGPLNIGWKIPKEDLRYVKFIYEVIRHLEKEDREYDKEQVRVLGGIRDKL